MQRRDFLRWTGTGMVFGPVVSEWVPPISVSSSACVEREEELLPFLIRENDAAVDRLLLRQNAQENTRGFGGIPNGYEIETAGGTAVFMQYMATAYVIRESRFFQSAQLILPLERAIDYLLRTQHEDGTIDLYSTNFHSTPDTGFVVEPLTIAYGLLRDEKQEQLSTVLTKLKSFLLNAGEALSSGGIHTPNHRWVVCMALARLHRLFPNTSYLTRINTWLKEGIDIDQDGQYTEKSTNIYTPLTNRCLITIARLLNKADLYEHVRQNLEMCLYYLHPNGEIATEASGRQDKYQVGTLRSHYYAYRYMALKDRNGKFAAITRQIPRLLPIAQLVRELGYMQEDLFLMADLPESEELPKSYEKLFSHSALARIRRGKWDATILAENPTFFTFQNGEAVLQGIRMAAAFFGKGQFEGDRMRRGEKGYLLKQYLEGPYYQPYPEEQLPTDGDWHKMPRSNRPQSEVQIYQVQVRIEEAERGFLLKFDVSGTAHVPIAIEIGFRHGGSLTGVKTVKGIPDAYLLPSGSATYQYGQDSIRIGMGQALHSWTQLRAAVPKMDAMSVYITGFTPFQWQLQVQSG
ncbi:MAG: hypothetical protein AAF587_04090 [Bacteroidota bacterium]